MSWREIIDLGDTGWLLADTLSIEKVTIVDSGNRHSLPTYVKGVTGSIIAIFEQIKNATGLDIPDILRVKQNID
jgi:hypothetical protein